MKSFFWHRTGNRLRPVFKGFCIPYRLGLIGLAFVWMMNSLLPVKAEEGIVDRDLEAKISSLDLVYVSDYVSFVGKDERGHVAFAIDNNRGKDGKTYQAEHFLVFHDQKQGWVEMVGNGAYDNSRHELLAIPDSPDFTFQGTPQKGLSIHSATNHLTLEMAPLEVHLSGTHEGARMWMGSAVAQLTWKGRQLEGRVIYEYLMMPNFNRLTRTYWGMWKEFQGFYLSLGSQGDLYIHSQQSEMLAPLLKPLTGFAVVEGTRDQVEQLTVAVKDRDFALGFYRWPVQWRLAWDGTQGRAHMDLQLKDRRVLANWVIGGFAMGIVEGTVTYAGRQMPYYGLVELLM